MEGSSQPAPVGGRSRRRGGNAKEVLGRGLEGGKMMGGAPCEPGQTPEADGCEAVGGRHMTRKQRASVKKVARALKAANKKAFRLAMTLKKKLRR
jgi:hypothetical protein